MTNVLLAGFTSYWHRRKSSMRTTQRERPPALRGCPLLRSVPSLWSGMREQSRSISRGLKINKNSAEGEVFLVDFPSYRTFQAVDEMAILVSILDSNCATGQETDHEQQHRRSLHYAYQPFRSPACRCDKADNHADRVSEPTVPPGTSSRQVQSDKSLSNST